MTVKIIGAGFGRTGTSSVARALEMLGLPCYHMQDVMFDPAHKGDVDFWLDAVADPDRPDRDWTKALHGKPATLDYPACAAWRGLARAYPQAKVLLTLHPGGAQAWYRSTMGTIYKGTDQHSASEFGARMNAMMDGLVWNGLLQGTMEDPAAAMARYEAHVAEVRAEIAPERLLVFSADQGWGPLCDFLGLPVPEGDFPRLNDREEMARTMARLDRMRRLARMRAA